MIIKPAVPNPYGFTHTINGAPVKGLTKMEQRMFAKQQGERIKDTERAQRSAKDSALRFGMGGK